MSELLKRHRLEILRIARSYGAKRLRVFGSFARGEERPDSDLDVLIDLEPGRDLLDIVAIKQDLEALLHCKVDVVTESAVSPYIREAVLRDAAVLRRQTGHICFTSETPSNGSSSTRPTAMPRS